MQSKILVLVSIDVLEYNLVHDKKTLHNFNTEDLENTIHIINDSIDEMKSYLSDPEENTALMTNFERTDDRNICNWCNFKKICFDLE